LSTGLDAQQTKFARNPDDRRAFEALEERFFLEGNVDELARLYRERIAVPSIEEDPEQLAALLFRLGQILEERILDSEAASEVYWRLARLDPTNRPALRQLRGIHEQQQQWDMVLQIAELEGATDMPPYERAAFESEQGRYWAEHLGDADEAQCAYERALESDPAFPAALEGLAAIHRAAGRHAESAQLFERLTDRLRGPERAPFWIALGILNAGPLKDPARAVECFEHALDDDPFSVAAVEWSLLLETAAENWPAVAGLLETRFDLASGARHRAAIAVEASQIQLSHLGSSAAARAWVERAVELAGEEISVLLAQADVERADGDTKRLLSTLDELISVGGRTVPRGVLIQAAELHSDAGQTDAAIEALNLAGEKSSGNDVALLTLQARLLREAGSKRQLAETLEILTDLGGFDDPKRLSEMLRELARIQEEDLSDDAGAEASWSRAFELDPSDDEALSALDRIHRKSSNWDALRATLESAMQARGSTARAEMAARLGELLLHQFEDEALAREHFDKAIEEDDQCIPALAGLRGLAESTGDDELLLDVCEKQALLCDDSQEMSELAQACIPILDARSAFGPALDWARRWQEMCPQAQQAVEWRAKFESALRLPEAEVVSRRALARLQQGAERATTLRRQAELHLELEDAVSAAGALELALECEPDTLATIIALADVYRTLGRSEDLSRCLRQWADALPRQEQTPILEELACLLHDPIGDLDAAIVVRWRIVDQPDASSEAALKLEALLELAGRYTEMAQLLDSRRAGLGDDSPEAFELDLRRGRLRLDALGQCEEAAAIFAALHERNPNDEAILDDLERALRTGNDAQGLCRLLEERAGWETDSERRLSMEFERATLLDEALGEPLEACDLYESIAREEAGTNHAIFALARLETMLESHGHWARLRTLLTSQIEEAAEDQRATLRERIAQICHERLGDVAGCAEQLEAIAETTTDRVHVWQRLEEIYRHELDRPADWLRVVEAELETHPNAEREYSLRMCAARLFLNEHKRPEGRDAREAMAHYERVLTLEPQQSEAAEALAAQYTADGRPEETLRVLETRLANLDESDVQRTSDLRLRIAELLTDPLDQKSRALAHYEAAREALGTIPRISDPLAELYLDLERFDELAALAREVLETGELEVAERKWRLRLGVSSRALGRLDEAALAYRTALLTTPNDREIEDALIEIYEEQDEYEPLAELLEKRLPYAPTEEVVDLRLRLARVHGEGRGAPAEALEQLEMILDMHPQHRDAFAFAVEMADRVGHPERLLALLDRSLATELPVAERAELLERKGILIAERLGNPEQALPCFREAIALAPGRESVRQELRKQLEGLERWPAVLDCLFVESTNAEPEEKIALLEHAAQIAWDHVGPDASLPWVARLRKERPDDPALLARLVEIHRRAGRFEAALRALDEEICMRPTEEDACRLYVERARLLEREIHTPGRAIVSYQQALSAAPGREQRDPILVELDRLYALTDRPVERAKILEERVSRLGSREGIELRQVLATIYCVDLVNPDLAIRPLLLNVDATRDDPLVHMAHLGSLDAALRASSRPDSWARVAERELQLIETHDEVRESTPPEYRLFLTDELARIYDEELGNPDRAIPHLRAVVDLNEDSSRAQERLLSLLRRCGHLTELTTRLAAYLEDNGGNASQWLELGLLREEQMHDLPAAMTAYHEARQDDQTALDALRGLRRCAERLHDYEALADALGALLEQTLRLDAAQRAATARKLGEVCWSKLGDSERAAAAFEHAIELEPKSLDSLQALTLIREAGEDREATFALYHREIELIGDEESLRDRARELWLRLAAGLHSDAGSARPSLEAYQAAAAIDRLEAADELRMARLHETLDESDAFCEVLGQWCDREDSPAGVEEHLELAGHLARAGSSRAARDRAKRATQVDSARPDAWVYLAQLEREAEEYEASADAFLQAADVADRRWAAEYCVEAAACLEGRNPERAWAHLTQALSHDPACFDAHVALTRAGGELRRPEKTLEHALCVFDAAESERLDAATGLELALLGARAATQCEQREAARRLFAIVVSIDPDQIEGLEGTARADFEVGDYRAARSALEHRIELPGENPDRGLHLSMIARGLESDELLDAAWTRYEEAIEVDPDFEDAHEGLVRVHERAARPEDALRCLER
jgi:tetratricopeptide (TPR) repeat protein